LHNIDSRFRAFSLIMRAIAALVLMTTALLPSGIVQQPGRALVVYQGAAAVTSANPTFIAIGGSTLANATELAVQVPSPANTTIQNMFVSLAIAPGAGSTATFTWRDNGSSEALTCTVSGAATACSDTTHSFKAAPGDLLDIQITVTGSVSSLIIGQTTLLSI
jgi:hypothetical protein